MARRRLLRELAAGRLRRPRRRALRGRLLPLSPSRTASQSGTIVAVSKQIAVRLPDQLVAFVDAVVESGSERSRAAVVTRALERERRRMIAARDAEILARTGQ